MSDDHTSQAIGAYGSRLAKLPPTATIDRLAGGGVKGGVPLGATDELGFHIAERPVHIHDLQATILHLLGLAHERLPFHHAGRDYRLTDVHGSVVHDILS